MRIITSIGDKMAQAKMGLGQNTQFLNTRQNMYGQVDPNKFFSILE